MEFDGIEAANPMQKWIREEFEYISHRRELGISDLNEERRIRHELQIQEFNGNFIDEWILQMEDSFHFFQFNETERIMYAVLSLAGDALQWFEWEHRRRPFYEWHELKSQVMQCFGLSTHLPSPPNPREVQPISFHPQYSGGNFEIFKERRLVNEPDIIGGLLRGFVGRDRGLFGGIAGESGSREELEQSAHLQKMSFDQNFCSVNGGLYGGGSLVEKDTTTSGGLMRASDGFKKGGGGSAGGPKAFDSSYNREGEEAREQNRRTFERGCAGSSCSRGGPGNSGRNWKQEEGKRGLKGGVADDGRNSGVELGGESQGDFARGYTGGGTSVGREGRGGHGENVEQGGGCGSGSGGGPGAGSCCTSGTTDFVDGSTNGDEVKKLKTNVEDEEPKGSLTGVFVGLEKNPELYGKGNQVIDYMMTSALWSEMCHVIPFTAKRLQ